MANNNYGLIKPLKTRTVLKNFKNDENQTFDTLAEEYGMAENIDKFMELLHKAVGNDNFSDMERINSKRIKKGKGNPIIINLKEDTTMKARIIKDTKANTNIQSVIISDLQEKAEVKATKIVDNKEETTMEKTIEMIREDLENTNNLIDLVISQRDTAIALFEDVNSSVIKQRKVVADIRIKLEEAERELTDLEAEATNNQAEVSARENELQELQGKKAELEAEITARETVVLLAPGKGGMISKNKKYVTVYERQGAQLVKLPASEWPFTWDISVLPEKAEQYGYTDFNRFMQDIQFAQLVIWYRLNNKPFELMADYNPNVLAIIEDEWSKTGA